MIYAEDSREQFALKSDLAILGKEKLRMGVASRQANYTVAKRL